MANVNTNSIVLSATIVNNFETYTKEDKASVVKGSVAVNRFINGNQKTHFFDVVTFGKDALAKYLVKGQSVIISGSLRDDRWQKDGKNLSKLVVVATDIELIDGSSKNDINTVVIKGNLTRNATVRSLPNGSFVHALSVAVNKGDYVNFIDVSFFSKKDLSEYLSKGKPLAISGQLIQETWEKDGKKFSKVSVSTSNIKLLGTPKKNNKSAESTPAPIPAQEAFVEASIDDSNDCPF